MEEPNVLLLTSLVNGDACGLRTSIENGANIQSRGRDHISVLHHAAKIGYPECIKVLISGGCNVDVKTTGDETPLHWASCVSAECVEELIQLGADINAKDFLGYTPLHRAVESKKPQCIKILLQRGADPDVLDEEGFTPLALAIHREYLTCVQQLIPNASIDKCDEDGLSPLHIATSRGFLRGLRKLLKAGADINTPGKVLLGLFQEEHLYCARMIVGKGRKVIHDKNGDIYSVKGACDECSRQLLSAKYLKNDETGVRPIHLSVFEGYVWLTRLLISKGADVNVKDGLGCTPLHVAVHINSSQLVKILIDAGANINAVLDNGITPLMIAARHNHFDCLEVLLRCGSPVDAGEATTALGFAASEGSVECLKLLIQQGADVNKPQQSGKSILYLAAVNSHSLCITELIKAGAVM